ncbi:hypothetical protein TUM12370_21230 [Salmonella enterica subsp. enterica serovar Choleraesuis]|nr:hypothetical protein TUM12370_21230 [Salmonella enterica subsp. enterica serovar Choleraesuis]
MRRIDWLVNGAVAFAFVTLMFMSVGIIKVRPTIMVPDALIIIIFALELIVKPLNNK